MRKNESKFHRDIINIHHDDFSFIFKHKPELYKYIIMIIPLFINNENQKFPLFTMELNELEKPLIGFIYSNDSSRHKIYRKCGEHFYKLSTSISYFLLQTMYMISTCQPSPTRKIMYDNLGRQL